MRDNPRNRDGIQWLWPTGHSKNSASVTEKNFQATEAACKNAKEELLRLQLERMVGACKQPRSSNTKFSKTNLRAASQGRSSELVDANIRRS